MGRRSFTKNSRKPTPIRKPSPPQVNNQTPINTQPSVLGTIGQGMSLGAGVAIGSTMVHGAMDAMSSKPEQKMNPCDNVMKQFQECSRMNTDLNVCKPFLDYYSQCISTQN